MCRICGCEKDAHGHTHTHTHDGTTHTHDGTTHTHEPPEGRRVAVELDLLAKNDRLAGDLRERLVRDRIVAINLIGAPGAGKTSLLEATIRALGTTPMAVIEGDQATDNDARRISATGCEVVQINTGAGCHLDASMMVAGVFRLEPRPRSLLFVENVGNLVCPALFDLGERAKVVVMSVTEGEDKPLKYPHVFRAARAVVLTKADLLPHLEVDVAAYADNARRVNPALEVFAVSARRGELADWCGWLRAQLEAP